MKLLGFNYEKKYKSKIGYVDVTYLKVFYILFIPIFSIEIDRTTFSKYFE